MDKYCIFPAWSLSRWKEYLYCLYLYCLYLYISLYLYWSQKNCGKTQLKGSIIKYVSRSYVKINTDNYYLFKVLSTIDKNLQQTQEVFQKTITQMNDYFILSSTQSLIKQIFNWALWQGQENTYLNPVFKNLSKILLGTKKHGKGQCNPFTGSISICIKTVVTENDHRSLYLEHAVRSIIWF